MIRVRMFVNYICNECVLFDVCGLNYNIEVGKQSVALLSMFCACVCVCAFACRDSSHSGSIIQNHLTQILGGKGF